MVELIIFDKIGALSKQNFSQSPSAHSTLALGLPTGRWQLARRFVIAVCGCGSSSASSSSSSLSFSLSFSSDFGSSSSSPLANFSLSFSSRAQVAALQAPETMREIGRAPPVQSLARAELRSRTATRPPPPLPPPLQSPLQPQPQSPPRLSAQRQRSASSLAASLQDESGTLQIIIPPGPLFRAPSLDPKVQSAP